MEDREWMYTGWSRTQAPSNDWIENSNIFLDHAFSVANIVEDETIKCPCVRCRNCVRNKRFTVEMHLCRFGFKEDYKIWTAHGEGLIDSSIEGGYGEGFGETDRMDEMLVDLAGEHPPPIDEEPAAYARAFYRMVESAEQSVHEKTTHSSLSAIACLLALKSQYNMSIAHFEDAEIFCH